jgi:hypothetical protein
VSRKISNWWGGPHGSVPPFDTDDECHRAAFAEREGRYRRSLARLEGEREGEDFVMLDGRRRALDSTAESQEAWSVSETASVLQSAVEVVLRLRDGSRWYVRVVDRSKAGRLVTRPWGWKRTMTIAAADVVRAVLVHGVSFEQVVRIGAAQRAAEGSR